MSATTSASWPADTDPALAAAVRYGVGLISVLRGFTRHVLGLGRVTQDVVAGLKSKGADFRSPQCGYDISAVITVLRRALLMADALRARLMTPAVALTMTRQPRAVSGGGGARQARAKDHDDPLAVILWRRTHAHTKEGIGNTIASMSDRQVVERIYTDLIAAAEVLRAHDRGSRILMLAYKAVLRIFPDLEALAKRKTASGAAARRNATSAPTAAGFAEAAEVPGIQPVPREVGRGPP